MKKLLSLLIALTLILSLGGAALAEEAAGADSADAKIASLRAEIDALKAQLDAAKAENASLQSQLTAALSEAQALSAQVRITAAEELVVAVVGNTVIYNTEPMAQFTQWADYYAMFGITDEETLDALKHDILDTYVNEAVLNEKARELGFDAFTEEELEENAALALELYESEIANYIEYYKEEDATDEEARAALIADMESQGYTPQAIEQNLLKTAVNDKLREMLTANVELTEEALIEYYDACVEKDREIYSEDPSEFEYAMFGGAPAYVPEGFRAVKQIFIALSDEQADALMSLEYELTDLNIAIEGQEERDEGDMNRKAELEAEIQAINDSLRARADEVAAKIAEGADFDALIELYGSDPEMTNVPGMTRDYYVWAGSDTWGAEFTEAAMALKDIGDISEPVRTYMGVHIIKYMGELTAGVVPLEDIRAALEPEALATLKEEAYEAGILAWREEMGVEVFYENMR